MYCVSCGTKLPDHARFCPSCGTPTSGGTDKVDALIDKLPRDFIEDVAADVVHSTMSEVESTVRQLVSIAKTGPVTEDDIDIAQGLLKSLRALDASLNRRNDNRFIVELRVYEDVERVEQALSDMWKVSGVGNQPYVFVAGVRLDDLLRSLVDTQTAGRIRQHRGIAEYVKTRAFYHWFLNHYGKEVTLLVADGLEQQVFGFDESPTIGRFVLQGLKGSRTVDDIINFHFDLIDHWSFFEPAMGRVQDQIKA